MCVSAVAIVSASLREQRIEDFAQIRCRGQFPYSGTGTSTTVTLAGLVDDTFYYKVQACLSASQCSAWVEASTSGTYLQRKGGQNAVPAAGSSTP